jgi:predicted ester cyclase
MQLTHFALATALVACTGSAVPEPRTTTMTTDANKQVVRRLYDECINPGRLDLLPELVSSDFVNPHGERGPAGFATALAGLRAGFPDIKITIEDLVAEGDRVTVRSSWAGTHTAAFRGIPPTGKRVTNTSITIYQLADHKLVHSWIESDRLGTLQQLGASPSAMGGMQPRPDGQPSER